MQGSNVSELKCMDVMIMPVSEFKFASVTV